MGGYAVECLLKVKLMRMFDCRTLRELEIELQRRGALPAGASVFTHELGILLRLTGGADRLRQNQPLWQRFNLVNRWVPAWRYSADLSNQADADDFLDGVKSIVGWIENNI